MHRAPCNFFTALARAFWSVQSFFPCARAFVFSQATVLRKRLRKAARDSRATGAVKDKRCCSTRHHPSIAFKSGETFGWRLTVSKPACRSAFKLSNSLMLSQRRNFSKSFTSGTFSSLGKWVTLAPPFREKGLDKVVVSGPRHVHRTFLAFVVGLLRKHPVHEQTIEKHTPYSDRCSLALRVRGRTNISIWK